MIWIRARRSSDVTYFTRDSGGEIDGLRDGGPGWWLRGAGDTTDPEAVSRVFTKGPRIEVIGYDIVVAAPRPLSVLLAVDLEQAPHVVRAHRVSVHAALEYLEDRALVVRRRFGGEDHDDAARWDQVVGFTHGVNRHAEPHLHDHVLVGSLPQGSKYALDSRSLYVHARAADALYRSTLRHEVSTRTTFQPWRSFGGVEQVEGLDEGYRALWGGHNEGRGEKYLWHRDEMVARWSRDSDLLESRGTVEIPRHRGPFDEQSFAGALEGLLNVTRRHVVEAWANATVFGQDPDSLRESIDFMYPALRDSRGIRESSIGVGQARLTPIVRECGPRPLELAELAAWQGRYRDRSRSIEARSR